MRDRVIAAVGEQYEIQAEIGRGGMAVVYRAMDLRLRRKVALKVLPPEFAFREDVRRRFQREAEMAARLSHPNIVPIYAVDERGGLVYFVMALVEGESLATLLARTPRLPVPAARRILHDVADALYYAHQHGVIHRDIKPDNILLDSESGRPMVSDFGIARAAETEGQLTLTGVAVGTPAYMSPEQSLGERELDGRSDIYSLGVVGYQMLAGELPFKASNTPAMMMKHVSTIPLPLRERRADAPAALCAAIDRSLAKRPEDRWATAAAFRDAIDARDENVEAWRHPVADAREAQLVPVAPPAARDPYEAARAGAREIVRAVLVPPSVPPLPVPVLQYPLSRQEQKQLMRERKQMRREGFQDLIENFRQRPLHERIMRFRGSLVSTMTMIGVLTTVNIVTWHGFPWVIFPAVALSMGVWRQWTRLWAEGVTWSQVWGPQAAKNIAAARAAAAQNAVPGAPAAIAPPDADALAAKLSTPQVLAGPHGAMVRRAAADRATVLGVVDSLAKADRDLIPDVVPTVNALAERVASVAQLLTDLDADASPRKLTELDEHIARVKAEPENSPDHERRLGLLERQRTSLAELGTRRARLAGQLESAGIALQNLKYDLLKLRSSGVQSAIGDVNSATIEARALSKEIGHVLEAADEIRDI
jgi:serine/threonine-protein kinase